MSTYIESNPSEEFFSSKYLYRLLTASISSKKDVIRCCWCGRIYSSKYLCLYVRQSKLIKIKRNFYFDEYLGIEDLKQSNFHNKNLNNNHNNQTK